MQALTYHGAHDVRVENMPDPELVDTDDIILRVTATAICGSDLHLYRGKVPMLKDGDILGHEFMGVVEETGSAVTRVRKGDRVVIPFVIACGECAFCLMQRYAACETTNPGPGGTLNSKEVRPPAALFGFSHLYGGIAGGQAEYVRVPKANTGPFTVPDTLPDAKVLFLSDILPTAYQAVLNAEVGPGKTVAIFGAGPVGLLCAACAQMMGAGEIFMVDHHQYRLDFATINYQITPINFDETDAAEEIVARTGNRGVDCVIDAVGFEAKGSITETVLSTLKIEAGSGKVLRQAIAAAKRGGTISVPGVYVGFLHGFMFGDIFDKGLTIKAGQTHVQKYMPELLKKIESGALDPELIITHTMRLQDAAEGYKIFDKKEQDCRKVVLIP